VLLPLLLLLLGGRPAPRRVPPAPALPWRSVRLPPAPPLRGGVTPYALVLSPDGPRSVRLGGPRSVRLRGPPPGRLRGPPPVRLPLLSGEPVSAR
jgi:hypothetical protein